MVTSGMEQQVCRSYSKFLNDTESAESDPDARPSSDFGQSEFWPLTLSFEVKTV